MILSAGADDNRTSFEGEISGLGSFSKIGLGNLSFARANLYEGSTQLSRVLIVVVV